jgi:ABC-type multidrug transport system fused ATPase/permease subunit
MILNTVWFILVTVLFIGFFFLEGFDYGVGILLPFLGKDDDERRAVINSIGPVWDGNEVWMITTGGALFASFPNVYATLFSGFYLALVLMLAVLTLSALAGFEAVMPLPLAAQTLSSSMQSARRLFEVVDVQPMVRETMSVRRDLLSESPITNLELRITNLAFSYPNQSQPT